ncbi:MAG: phosphoenolpyruvate synthase, partial [Prevotella sp.]|nr:phosphoenolpyruvate synthase [Prevotella sp.]
TYDPVDQVIRDGIYEGGRKIISFCGVLQQGIFPLPQLLQLSQKFGSEEMRRPVEIEFACNLYKSEEREVVSGDLYLLQIRPIVDSKQVLDEDLQQIPDSQCLLRSTNSLGHGISEDVVDVVYVKAGEDFTAANNPTSASHIELINQRFLDEGKNYVLVGPGRWGSSDYWLGIPVKWPHISAARVIVESGLKNYHVDPSQGTHFFQNLTSFGVGYFTINTYTGDGVFQQDILDAMPAIEETEYVRHVRFERPLKIMMDGKKQHGVVMLPE